MKKVLLAVFIFLTIPLDCKCRKLPEVPKIRFELSGSVEPGTETLYLDEQGHAKLTLTITPENELGKNVFYQVVGWQVKGGLSGFLLDKNVEKVSTKTRFVAGENELYYRPMEVGAHTLHLQVADQYKDQKRYGPTRRSR